MSSDTKLFVNSCNSSISVVIGHFALEIHALTKKCLHYIHDHRPGRITNEVNEVLQVRRVVRTLWLGTGKSVRKSVK